MNNLNSVLLEGHLVNNPEYTEKGGSFTIQVNRFYKKNDDVEKESYNFNVTISSYQIGYMKPLLSKGKYIRIVGRLSEKNGSVTITADHIEFKPDLVRDKI